MKPDYGKIAVMCGVEERPLFPELGTDIFKARKEFIREYRRLPVQVTISLEDYKQFLRYHKAITKSPRAPDALYGLKLVYRVSLPIGKFEIS